MLTNMHPWSDVRRRVLSGELTLRQAAAEYGLNFRTVRKVVAQPEPEPYRRPTPRAKPILGPFLPLIHQILDDDRHAPPKQRHTARRIYERLRDEHHYRGCASIARDAVRACKQSHFAFAAHFCRVRRAHGKGPVENGVGYVRRDFLAPVPQADSWEDLNVRLAAACRRGWDRRATGAAAATAGLSAADRAAFLPTPAEPFEGRRVELVTISSLSSGRFDGNDYSVPARFACQSLTAAGTIDRVRFSRRGAVVAEHARRWAKRQVTFDPLHYLALLERKPGAPDPAKPLAGWASPDCFARLRRRLEEADPGGGARQYIRVLRLLEAHELAAAAAAGERALAPAVADAGAVRRLLEPARQRSVAGSDLAGRPRRPAVHLPPPDLAAHPHSTSGKGVKS